MTHPPKLLGPAEVAQHLEVTRRTVYRWIESGQLPARKAGRKWRVSREDLEGFLRPRESSLRVAAVSKSPPSRPTNPDDAARDRYLSNRELRALMPRLSTPSEALLREERDQR